MSDCPLGQILGMPLHLTTCQLYDPLISLVDHDYKSCENRIVIIMLGYSRLIYRNYTSFISTGYIEDVTTVQRIAIQDLFEHQVCVITHSIWDVSL